jgi:hypothetical protein
LKGSIQPHGRRGPAGPTRAALGAIALGLVLTGPAAAEPDRLDPDTGAATWEARAHGVTLALTQLLPDQVRAFYVNRGFRLEDAEVFALACVYMAVMRNDAAPGVIRFRQADWTVRSNGEAHPVPPVDDWLEQWEARGVPAPARLAFRWAQLPPEQSYAPGEWNQGMLATGLPPGSRFDLIARWTLAGQPYEVTLSDVRCTD